MSNILKIYNVGNLGIGKSNLFIGNTYISEIDKRKNDFSTFLFASIVGGRNVRVDQSTEKDPYIFVDSRFYTFKPYSYYVDYTNSTTLDTLETNYPPSTQSFLKTIINKITSSTSGDINVNVKNLKTNNKLTFYLDPAHNEIILKAANYGLKNTVQDKSIKIFDGTRKDSKGNVNFFIKKLIEGNCLKIDQILEFGWTAPSSSSSSSLSSSSWSSLSSLSSNSSSSSSTSSSSYESDFTEDSEESDGCPSSSSTSSSLSLVSTSSTSSSSSSSSSESSYNGFVQQLFVVPEDIIF